ncbi:MAG: secondary thiamine-phosphate synthase enzyme YjbQ [Prevotella sp.]|jgi:secondary thiamine-phosphate synthase enzyme|uniref:Secondary thiamine-phosphate synthase enzyme YjbQ n=1 Tax=Segatella cerevisiae TaxID=2053716 RepID=A0ABT1BU37_9BACT|nr:secondary thiamine-phosphate synthase enzyme YjbQ [Segatella cerevisiae]MCH3993693.1 secondary thiamine-phosphate synthase enzyme YjbQ [Prevotella sp.]MCI1245944.1 secondary thiamine-phosphate synthase enzyme YjbQ [Prevotella sp.]MCO6024606.1 secondary thiamine-phosphate synthase enzyme YjbQ [Segatella cerevisiae]
MIRQKEMILKEYDRGFHLITDEVVSQLPALPETGLLNLFVKHTSCALSVCENWDPSVRADLEQIYDRLVRERQPYYLHTLEGDDDMPAHAKTVLTGVSLNIPITEGRLNLGTWQGIYLCEFRNEGGRRHIVATVIG